MVTACNSARACGDPPSRNGDLPSGNPCVGTPIWIGHSGPLPIAKELSGNLGRRATACLGYRRSYRLLRISDIRSSIPVKPHDGYNYPGLEILASDGSRKLVTGRFSTVRTETSRNSVSTNTNRAAIIFFKSILVFIIRRRCLLAEQCYNHSPYWTSLAPCPRKEYSHET